MDSRDHGNSSDSATAINYEKMTDDLAALIDHLKTGPVDVIGWSDGGIEALLLGIRHPDKVKKLVVMAANLNPSTDAVYPEVLALFDPSQMPEDLKATPEGKRQAKVSGMTQTEPNIDPAELAKVTAPTLIVAGDHDLIRTEHTVEIFNALPNANLAILPNSTHAAPLEDPVLFNATAERFLTTPFKKKDRIADMMASIEKAMAEAAK
jgi:pimeloyl-ACP methyl ester carboxylesterase